mmetsp:Transcript_4501/g.13572  ORF Transcript_4501/g.13572 Transcript_4501/m.13572 type:complete len:214 (+) Transcript_4501:228-869(+)
MPVLRAARRGDALRRVRLGEEVLEVRVVEDARSGRPRAIEAGALGLAAADGVGPAQSDDVPVAEALRVEDLAEVRDALVAVREPAFLGSDRFRGARRVDAAEARRDPRAAHGLGRDVRRLRVPSVLEFLGRVQRRARIFPPRPPRAPRGRRGRSRRARRTSPRRARAVRWRHPGPRSPRRRPRRRRGSAGPRSGSRLSARRSRRRPRRATRAG